MNIKEHKSQFKPQARILELLGEQLIRNHRIALFELVKNSYDADAPEVSVCFHNIQDENKAFIIVRDSGEGMDLDTILNIWLEPASDHKATKRKNGERSLKFGRLPVGEKGVGRFAAQKLGSSITLITRKNKEKEIQVKIDWNILSNHKYLSDVPVIVTERNPEVFTDNSHGTLIRIDSLKQKWTRGDIRRLYRSVNAMVSPFKSKDQFYVDFKIEPKSDWLDGMFTPQDAEQFSLFQFEFLLDEDGFQWEYKFTPFTSLQADYKEEIKPREKRVSNDPAFEFFSLKPPASSPTSSWAKREKRAESVVLKPQKGGLGIGPIFGRLIVFDLDREITARYINDSSGLSEFLKEQGGMRVYRDGMRVYDYGEPGNDWLGLDVRRVQTPTRRLSNNLFLGEVHLDLVSSPFLEEKTNREGFVENDSYWEFQYAILCALTTFEAERQKDKETLRSCFKLTNEERQSHLHGPEEAIESLRKKVLREGLADKLGSYVDRVEKSYTEARNVLMSAVGSGLGLSMVFHEMERGVRGLHLALEKGKPVDTLKEMSEHLVKLLEGAAYLVKSNKPEPIKASVLVSHAVFTLETRFDYHNIRFVNGFDGLPDQDFTLKGSRRMLLAALTNLIDNAIQWVKISRKSENKDDAFIWVGPSNDLEMPAILVADNGPGFQDPPEDLIKPFFTRRLEGMGLGLYYADMAMKANNGRLSFPESDDVDIPKKCTGGIVAMVFNEGKR